MKKGMLIGLIGIAFLLGINNIEAKTCTYVNANKTSKITCNIDSYYNIGCSVDGGTSVVPTNWEYHQFFLTTYKEKYKNFEQCPSHMGKGGGLYFYEYESEYTEYINHLYNDLMQNITINDIITYDIEGTNVINRETIIADIEEKIANVKQEISDFKAEDCCEYCDVDDTNCPESGYYVDRCYSQAIGVSNMIWDNLPEQDSIEKNLNTYKTVLGDDLYLEYMEKLEELEVSAHNLIVKINRGNFCPEEPFVAKCGIFGKKTWKYVKDIYTIIKILIPALVILLGMVDFMKVVFSGEEKDMKTAGHRFLKRIIAGVIFILLPVLLQFVMKLFGFSENCLQELIWIIR